MDSLSLVFGEIEISFDVSARNMARVSSKLHDSKQPMNSAFNLAVSGLESTILSDFVSGVYVQSDEYCLLITRAYASLKSGNVIDTVFNMFGEMSLVGDYLITPDSMIAGLA